MKEKSSAKAQQKVALVTGANRGIGQEVVRQLAREGFVALLGARDLAKGKEAAEKIVAKGLGIHAVQLDVTDESSVQRAVADAEKRFGRIDVLVNNAAILYDDWQKGLDADFTQVRDALETNLLGAWRMCKACAPLMRKQRYGRIVNVSSESGSLASMGAGTPAYGISKAALNALTRILAAELRGSGVLVNSVCPGWVRTDMGGKNAPRSVPEGARGILWAAMLPDDGPTGGFFRDSKPLPW
ncbi:MAG: SDR family oxidoreductase [Candidatus Acidiferrales bacterium]